MRALPILLACAACASGRQVSDIDAAGDDDVDAAIDAPEIDATDAAAIDAAIDATIDAAAIDARVDAAIDATIDAVPIDAPTDAPIDAPGCTNPIWHDILGNGGFETGIAPWTQTSTIIRTAATMPFAPQAGTYAAEFGASNNANDVLVQTLTIPAGSTGLRVRGYQCHVTEDVISDADSFTVTLQTPAGVVLETFTDITNSDIAPLCVWLPFTWTATGGHPGETVVLHFRGRTNIAFLTRFIVDSVSLEWLGC